MIFWTGDSWAFKGQVWGNNNRGILTKTLSDSAHNKVIVRYYIECISGDEAILKKPVNVYIQRKDPFDTD